MEDHIITTREDIETIKNNHLAHVEKDITELKTGMTGVVTDLVWLKKFFWLIATASVGSLATGLINLLLRIS